MKEDKKERGENQGGDSPTPRASRIVKFQNILCEAILVLIAQGVKRSKAVRM